jgi:hypothetical protein
MSDLVRARVRAALARRVAAQPEAVRRLLAAKLASTEGDGPTQVRTPQRSATRAGSCPPLAELNARLRDLAAAKSGPLPPGETHDPQELASVRRFRRAWDRGRTLDQVEQALARKPANAGPLNSHALVLQSLALMRELSPEYLRHFLRYAESLQWLAQANDRLPRESAKPATGARRGKKK